MKKEALTLLLIGLLFVLGIIGVLLRSEEFNNSFSSPDFQSSKDGIVVLHLAGPVGFSSNPYMPSSYGVEGLIDQLNILDDNPHVKALVIRINSPGGTVGAAQELYRSILKFKKKMKIPVVASIGDIGASGAYYAALGADYIFANPGSMVGSIGAYIGNYDVSELAKQYGVDYHIYKSGAYKDMLSPWRKPSTEEAQLLQSMITGIHRQFVTALIGSRKITEPQALLLAQGQVYTGEDAMNVKLVDFLGGLQEAVEFAHHKAALSGEPVILKHSGNGFRDVMSYWWSQLDSKFQGQLFSPALPKLK